MRVKNFLKTDRYQHKDASVRLQAVINMDDTDPERGRILKQLASEDTDLSVRLAAIERLLDLEVLLRLSKVKSDESAAITEAVELRLVQLLQRDAIEFAQLSNQLSTHARLAELVACHSVQGELREQALQCMHTETDFLTIVQRTRFHDTRLEAAVKLSHHDMLKAALSACRSRDKVVAKHLQLQLEEHAAAEAALIAAQHESTSCLSAMRQLAGSVWSPQHAGKYQSLINRWQVLDTDMKNVHAIAFDDVARQVQKMITDHAQSAAAVKAVDEANAAKNDSDSASIVDVAADASKKTDNSTDATVAVTPAATNVPATPPDPAIVALAGKLSTVSLDDLPSQLNSLATESPSDAAAPLLAHAKAVTVLFDPPLDINKARPTELRHYLKRVDALLDTNSCLPTVPTESLRYLSDLQAHREIGEQRVAKAAQESADRVRATHKQFSALSAAIGKGQWGPANSMFKRLQRKINAMDVTEKNQLQDKLVKAERQLDEMADWQDFAARPKLEALCEKMEALPAQSLAPEAVAQSVKSLQAEWKALGVSRAANELWQRFKTAGDIAYEPCKEFFAKKQANRDEKTANKRALCDKLESLHKDMDWDAVDWKSVQRAIQQAKRDWSQNRVVDRKPDKALEDRFSSALQPFETALAEQYDANAAIKQELVDKVASLAEADINQHVINQTRRLQASWKQTGIMRRKQDQELWEQFNASCRTIFKQQHDTQREQYKASMSHVYRARDIIKELRKMSKSGAADEQQVQTLSNEFQALKDFPDKDRKGLLRDFRGAVDACARLQADEGRRRKQAEGAEVQRLVELCERLEAAVLSPELRVDTLQEDVSHAWDATDVVVNRDVATRLQKRRDKALQHLDKGSVYDVDAAETARREILIQMEILAGLDTPAEDKARRMQYQLAHLQEGMTSSAAADKTVEVARLDLAWMTTPTARLEIRDTLNSRYLAAMSR